MHNEVEILFTALKLEHMLCVHNFLISYMGKNEVQHLQNKTFKLSSGNFFQLLMVSLIFHKANANDSKVLL